MIVGILYLIVSVVAQESADPTTASYGSYAPTPGAPTPRASIEYSTVGTDALPFATVPYTTWTDAYADDFEYQGDLFSDVYEPSYLCYQPEFTIEDFTAPYTTESASQGETGTVQPTTQAAAPSPSPRATFFLPTSGVLHWDRVTDAPQPWEQSSYTTVATPAAPSNTPSNTPAVAPSGAPAATRATTYAPGTETDATTIAAPAGYTMGSYAGESYTVYHAIAIATDSTVNRDFRRLLANVLGLDMGEMVNSEVYEKPNGQKLFVFSLGSGYDDRFCQVYRTLTGLDPWFAKQLGVGGVDAVIVRADEQFRMDSGDSAAAHVALASAALTMSLMSIV